MEHVRALIIKFIMCTVALWIVLSLFYGVSFGNVVWIGIVLTILSYALGDLLILPFAGNMAATAADFGLTFLTVWLMGAYLFDPAIPAALTAFFSAIVITIGEWFFHNYMGKTVLEDRRTEA